MEILHTKILKMSHESVSIPLDTSNMMELAMHAQSINIIEMRLKNIIMIRSLSHKSSNDYSFEI